MPRTGQSFVVQHTQKDGSVLSARVSERPEHTYEIDLRRWKKGRPTLKARGCRAGTRNVGEARQLAVDMLAALGKGSAGATDHALIGPLTMIDQYIQGRLDGGFMRQETAAQVATRLLRVWTHFAEDRGFMRWDQVQRKDIPELAAYLKDREFTANGRRYKLATNSQLGYMNSLKGFFRWLEDTEVIPASPIHRHGSVPKLDKSFKRDWLEPHEVGMFLKAVFAGRKSYPANACRSFPEIAASECYTGAREGEMLGLAFSEWTPDGGVHGAGTMRIQDNKWRKIKNEDSERVIHLWPAHGKIIRDYVARAKPPMGGLMFPNPDGQMWSDLRESMERDLKAAGIVKHISPHCLRHSYVSLRARCVKEVVVRGKITRVAVHPEDIMKEVGHGSTKMTLDVYKHASEDATLDATVVDYPAFLKDFEKRLGHSATGKRASASAASTKRKR